MKVGQLPHLLRFQLSARFYIFLTPPERQRQPTDQQRQKYISPQPAPAAQKRSHVFYIPLLPMYRVIS